MPIDAPLDRRRAVEWSDPRALIAGEVPPAPMIALPGVEPVAVDPGREASATPAIDPVIAAWTRIS